METKAKLGSRAIGRRGKENDQGYELKEPQSPYNRVFDPEKCGLTYISLFEKIFLELLDNIVTNHSGAFELPPAGLKIFVNRAGIL